MLENGLFRQVGRKWVNETGLVVRVLLEKYKDLFEINERDIHGRTVSHLAAHFGRLDALRAIVEMCNDVEFDLTDKDGRTALHYAASRGHMDEIVTSLEKRGEFEAEDEDEDIWEALDDSDSSEWSESDSDGQDNVQNDDEWNGTEHCVNVLSLLLDTCNHGIINAQDKQGLTVFHLASIAGDGTIVTKLLSDERDIDVNAKDVYGWTALHMAVFHRCSRVVETLMKCSLVDINIQDQRGQTPLHLAASRGRLKIVKALLENGRNIDLDLKDEEQRTALDLAEEGNHAQVVDILKAEIGHGSG
jgi:ankyrin repeat protein